jgi:hypothetical protein
MYCGLFSVFGFIMLFAMSLDTLEPAEFGIVKNGFTGSVDLNPDNVYTGGRYFLWPRHYFLVFPRNLRSLEFEEGNDRPPIPARTGPDPDDRESGGQPVSLSVAFQYQLQKRSVPNIYQTYGLAWEASYLRFAQHALQVKRRIQPDFLFQRFISQAGYDQYMVTDWRLAEYKMPCIIGYRADG